MTCDRCTTPVPDVRAYRRRLRRAGLAGAGLPALCAACERRFYIALSCRLSTWPRPRPAPQPQPQMGIRSQVIPICRPQQADHAAALQLGGKWSADAFLPESDICPKSGECLPHVADVADVVPAGKRVKLRVLHERPTPAGFEWVTEPGRVPATRGQCPPIAADGKRWCGYVRCRHHMWRIDGHDRAGRRWAGRNSVRLAIVDMRSPHACVLDVVDAHNALPMTHGEIGAATGLCERQIRRAFNAAVRSSSGLADAERLLEEMVNR